MSNPQIAAIGGCLCQAVRYEIHGPLRDVIACHCTQCRRTSGHSLLRKLATIITFPMTQ